MPFPTAATTSQLAADINYADTTGGAFTINLQPSATFALTTGALPVVGGAKAVDLTIHGNGGTIDGLGLVGLFRVAGASLTLDHVTLRGGYAAVVDGAGGAGGGIFNSGGTVTLSNSILSNCSAGDGALDHGGYGGAVWNGGTLVISNSVISNNGAGALGGGIYNGGTVTVTNSTLSGNVCYLFYGDPETYSDGGAIYNAEGSTVTINHSTVSGNSVDLSYGSGGGIYNGWLSTLTVENYSSIAGNRAVRGADVYNDGVVHVDSTSSIGSQPTFVGDYNEDGVVDAADYSVWRDKLGSTVVAYSGADGDGDGTIDQDDYNVWRSHFGQTLPPQPAGGLGMGGTATDGALVAATSIEQSSQVAPPTTNTESAEALGPSTNVGLLASQMAAPAVDLSFALDSGIGDDTTQAARSQVRAVAGGPQLTAAVVDQLLLLCPTGTEARMLAAVDAHVKSSANKSSADRVHFGSVVDAIFEELVPASTDPVCS